jgi:predicted small lipoprotein YifL
MSLRLVKIITLFFVVAVYGGCGQKGELYLPGEKQTAVVVNSHIV